MLASKKNQWRLVSRCCYLLGKSPGGLEPCIQTNIVTASYINKAQERRPANSCLCMLQRRSLKRAKMRNAFKACLRPNSSLVHTMSRKRNAKNPHDLMQPE